MCAGVRSLACVRVHGTVGQVCLEGDISQESVRASLARGERASGDLIPWTLSQQFQDNDFPQLSGARIVRIADWARIDEPARLRRVVENSAETFAPLRAENGAQR